MMRYFTWVAALLMLAGCNTPPLGFAGVAATRVTVEQSTFDVRIKDDRANAIRLNREFAPNLAAVAPRAGQAMMQVSGCDIVPGSMTGDASVVTARLTCGGPTGTSE